MFRSRLISFFLLLASPAVGGTVLPVAHPCPVDAPWLASTAGHHRHAHGGHHQQSKTPSGQSGHTCTCPGTCSAGVAIVVPTSVNGRQLTTSPLRILLSALTQPLGWSQSRLDLLPPSTAPPLE